MAETSRGMWSYFSQRFDREYGASHPLEFYFFEFLDMETFDPQKTRAPFHAMQP
jgi:hypothetical protein